MRPSALKHSQRSRNAASRTTFESRVRDGPLSEHIVGTTTQHDLRHHYASVMLLAGASVVAVAEQLGHENAALVLSTCGHLMPASEDRTRRAFDEAWWAPAETEQRRNGGQP